jgi:acyl-CoA reductase-like NAD-dependent aldehyde dehydrogenase
LVNKQDIQEVYESAQKAQKFWQQTDPKEKTAIIQKAIAYMENHNEEIVQLLIEEMGSAFSKARVEAMNTIATMQEAAKFPA